MKSSPLLKWQNEYGEEKMDLNEYQCEAQKTSIYPALGLAGEAGEVANQVKKIIRDNDGQLTDDRKNKIIDELGDVLWYMAAIATDLELSLDMVAQGNLSKLEKRNSSSLVHGDKRS